MLSSNIRKALDKYRTPLIGTILAVFLVMGFVETRKLDQMGFELISVILAFILALVSIIFIIPFVIEVFSKQIDDGWYEYVTIYAGFVFLLIIFTEIISIQEIPCEKYDKIAAMTKEVPTLKKKLDFIDEDGITYSDYGKIRKLYQKECVVIAIQKIKN